MQRPPLYERSPSFYYLAASLVESERRETREITRRARKRKAFNPMAVNDTEFKKRYRLNKEAYIYLCNKLKEKTSLASSRRSTFELKVLCALSFYATGSYQHIVGMSTYLAQTTVSKYVKEVTDALISPAMLSEFIRFPHTRACRDITKNKFFDKYGFPGVVGCIDGCHFHIFTPKKDTEHLYYSRKHFHSLNVQMVCDSDYRILNINARYGGATHDAFIWANSQLNPYLQELHQNNEQVWLLGDSGYPQRPWLMTPILNAANGTPEHKYTIIHGRTRVAIENTFGQLKNRWRCLCKDRTLHYTPQKCASIITACGVLHNIMISIKQDMSDLIIEHPNYSSSNIFEENETDDLLRGRAIRSVLVTRINRLH